MNGTRQRLRTAVQAALALVIAGALVVGTPAQAASSDAYASRAAYLSAQSPAQAYPNPQYPNHKPLRGNYPGSYTSTSSTPAQPPSSPFDWLAAAVGAAGMLGLILLIAASRSAMRIARNRKHGIPFVIDVRDDTPSTG
jgi:cysteine synthase